MSEDVKDQHDKAAALSGKFFIIVDGDDGICLVSVSPPSVRYLDLGDLHFVRQHLDMKPEERGLEHIALRLAGKGEPEKLLNWMKAVRNSNVDGSFESGGTRLVNACLVGEAPLELIVARGRR